MKLSRTEFMAQPRKRITLIGMSGVGKSHLACRLADWGWVNYSCDYLIATKYLKDFLGDGASVSPENISNLSAFVGQIGAVDKGGVGLEEFRRRQRLYYEAECNAVRDFGAAITEAGERHVVNDAAGSLCEIEDEKLLETLGGQSLFVYLKVRPENHKQILERAIWTPKPLYFPAAFFDEHLAAFMDKFGIGDAEEIEPEMFLRWVFPHLFEARLPKYQALADRYGVTVYVDEIAEVGTEEEFLNAVAEALDE